MTVSTSGFAPGSTSVTVAEGFVGGRSFASMHLLTLFVAEYIHTLPMEVEFMWPSQLSLGQALFYALRYFPFLDLPLASCLVMSSSLSTKGCQALSVYIIFCIFFSMVLAEAILFLRVYALGGGGRQLKVYLISHFVLIHLGATALGLRFSVEAQAHVVALHMAPFPNCWTLEISRPTLLSATYGMILFNEFVVMTITLWFGYKSYRSMKSPLFNVFYRDGAFYFVALTVASLANILVNLLAPIAYVSLLSVFQRTIHSILATRMILHLRKVAAVGSEAVTFDLQSPVVPMSFATTPTSAQTTAASSVR